MSISSSSGAYRFSIKYVRTSWGNYWRMHWRVDRYHHGDRCRYPHGFSRNTEDEKAAKRFCKKHNLDFPPVLDIQYLTPSKNSVK
jgi:hypothetical protein